MGNPPAKTAKEKAEKKAREFIEASGLLPNASPFYALTEYILKTEKTHPSQSLGEDKQVKK